MVGARDKEPSVYMIGYDCDRKAAASFAYFVQTRWKRRY